jgi:nitrate reductase NapE component
VIRALFLIFNPVASWDRILEAQRSIRFLLVRYLLPMMLIVAFVEGFGMVVWGKPQTVIHRIQKFAVGEAVVYEIARFVMMLGVVAICGILIKVFGDTFRGRHTYRQTFTLVIYGLSPLFLFRLLDVTPMLNPWIAWGFGIVLCTEVLYQGVPRVMEPDPPNAFGLYFMSSLVLVAATGLERFVTAWFLAGRMRPIKDIIDGILGHPPG